MTLAGGEVTLALERGRRTTWDELPANLKAIVMGVRPPAEQVVAHYWTK